MTSTLYPVQLVMIGFAVAYFLFEIFLNVNDVKDDTSNVVLFNWTRKRRMIFIPFTLGAVGGHLFLGTENEYFGLGDGTLPVLVLLGVIVLLVLAGIFLLRKDRLVPRWLITTILILGFAFGHFVWSMNFEQPSLKSAETVDCPSFNYSCNDCLKCSNE